MNLRAFSRLIVSVGWFVVAGHIVSVMAGAEPARYPLYRSEDGGVTWKTSDAGLPGRARINALTATGRIVAAGTDAGIFISADEGRTWQASSISGPAGSRVVALASLKDHLFASAGTAILASDDHGKTWRTNQTFPRQIARSFLTTDGALYVGTDRAGVFRTIDLGRSWARLADGMPANAQVLALASVDSEVFAGLYSGGLFRLDASAQSWIRAGVAGTNRVIQPLALAAAGSTLIAGHNPGGIHVSHDRGRTWTAWKGEEPPSGSTFEPFETLNRSESVSLNAPVWELAALGNLALAGVVDGIFYSHDHGRHWMRATQGLPSGAPGVAFLVRTNLVLAAVVLQPKSSSTSGNGE